MQAASGRCSDRWGTKGPASRSLCSLRGGPPQHLTQDDGHGALYGRPRRPLYLSIFRSHCLQPSTRIRCVVRVGVVCRMLVTISRRDQLEASGMITGGQQHLEHKRLQGRAPVSDGLVRGQVHVHQDLAFGVLGDVVDDLHRALAVGGLGPRCTTTPRGLWIGLQLLPR